MASSLQTVQVYNTTKTITPEYKFSISQGSIEETTIHTEEGLLQVVPMCQLYQLIQLRCFDAGQ